MGNGYFFGEWLRADRSTEVATTSSEVTGSSEQFHKILTEVPRTSTEDSMTSTKVPMTAEEFARAST